MSIQDAERVAIRHHDQLDWPYIEEQLRPLAEVKDPRILHALACLRQLQSSS